MRFPQILMLLVVLCVLIFSCRETLGEKETFPQQDTSIPSAEEHQKTKPTQKKVYPIPGDHSRDSISRKQKKSRDLDTLKPKVALLSI